MWDHNTAVAQSILNSDNIKDSCEQTKIKHLFSLQIYMQRHLQGDNVIYF